MDPDVDPRIPEPVSASALPEFEDAPLKGRERIDRGGDADVYRSTVEYQGESYRVAVKQPRFQGTLGRRRLENFEAEVEVWNTLGDHDNIVSVYGWGTRPEPWLALEYMDAGTLKSKLGTVDLAEALWLAGRIAEGVHYGHRNGIAHLDLKPSNILCRETGPGMWTYPKIADWGLAKLLLEGSSVTDGYSSQYAAPEQRAPDRFGEPNDITDIYQLGAVVYSLLTGDPPETRSITDTGTESFRTPNPPSYRNPAIPSVVDEAVLTALEPVPSDRYDSVVTLRNELDRGLTEVLDDADETTGDALKIEDSADISPESTDDRIKDLNPRGASNMPETGVSNRSASVEKTAGQPSNIDSEFICPNCDSTWVLSSSIRSGDVCPECHNGYVVEQNRQDGDTAGAVDREREEVDDDSSQTSSNNHDPVSYLSSSAGPNPKLDEESHDVPENYQTKITVVGCGGAGGSTVNRIAEEGIERTNLVAADMSERRLVDVEADTKIVMGEEKSGVLGARSRPQIGEEAAIESQEDIYDAIEGSDMVFVTAGLGGGTGTGAAPVIAEAAQDSGALTIAIVTTPLSSEGEVRRTNAEAGLERLRDVADTVIVVPNDRLLDSIGKLPIKQAFKVSDEMLMLSVKGITELITQPGLVDLDFADVKTVMEQGGVAMIGLGKSDSEQKAQDSVRSALRSPILDVDISDANSSLVNITGGTDMAIEEAEGVVGEISDRLAPDTRIVRNILINDEFEGEMDTMIVVTGIGISQIYDKNKTEQERGAR